MTPSQVHKSAVLSINVFFNTNYNNYYKVSVVVSMSRQWQMLLLAWRKHDESLTWWWQDNRCSANRNLLFLGQASFSGSQRCLQTVNFLLPLHYPLVPAVNTSAAVYILSHALDGLSREKQRVYEQVRRLWAYLPCHSGNDGGLGGLHNLRLLRKSI